MIPFYVINYDFNRNVFEPYEVMRYFINEYNEIKSKPKTTEELKEFVERKSLCRFWSRCEYEIILVDWPCQKTSEKWDVHKQIMMNIDIIVKLLKENLGWQSSME